MAKSRQHRFVVSEHEEFDLISAARRNEPTRKNVRVSPVHEAELLYFAPRSERIAAIEHVRRRPLLTDH